MNSTTSPNPTFALWALAISAFAIGTTEFIIVGLLPSIAADLNISLTLTGLLISGYALGVAVGAPVLTSLTSRMSRKALLLMVMLVFIAGNAVAALAVNFGMLMLGRIISAFAHGVFFSIGSTIAADLVPPDKRASAIAPMTSRCRFLPNGCGVGKRCPSRHRPLGRSVR